MRNVLVAKLLEGVLEVFGVLRMGPGGYVTTPLLWSPTQAGGATFHKRGLEIQKPSSHIAHGPAVGIKINQTSLTVLLSP